MFNINKFKDRTKALCGQYGISQKYLCDQLGKQKTYLNDVWRGRCTPTDADLKILAYRLHTTPEYLRGETDNPDSLESDVMAKIKADPQKMEIFERLADMDVETLLKIEKILDMIKGEQS